MKEEEKGLNRQEMTSALKRKGQRLIPIKWDDFSQRFLNINGAKMQELWQTYGKDYVQTAPAYSSTGIGYGEWKDEWGCTWKTLDPEEVGGQMVAHPYDDVDKAIKAKLPDPELKERLEPIMNARKEHPDKFLWVQMWMGPWEHCRALVGTEEMLTSLHLKRANAEKLINMVYEHFRILIRNIATLDVDLIGIADDWGTEKSLLISPKMWSDIFAKHYANIFAEIKSAGKMSFYHSCGCVAELYPYLIDMGLDVLNPLQPGPVDIKSVGRKYKGKITFWGGIDTRQLLERGTPEMVESAVNDLIETLGLPEGGLVVGHCTSVHSATPVENIASMFKTARNFKWR